MLPARSLSASTSPFRPYQYSFSSALCGSGSGFLPFDSEDRVTANVTRLGNLNARKLVVLVNPTTQEYRIDWERSALVNGLVPAQFTLAEDNRTYDLSGQAGPLMEILSILKANNVPLDRMVDIRSNPVLREQIQAVVRRAAEQQAPTAPPAPAAQPVPVVEDLQQVVVLLGSDRRQPEIINDQ